MLKVRKTVRYVSVVLTLKVIQLFSVMCARLVFIWFVMAYEEFQNVKSIVVRFVHNINNQKFYQDRIVGYVKRVVFQ